MINVSNEIAELVNDRTFRLTAEKLVLKCGVRADLKGFVCLVDAIILFGTESCRSFCEIYRTIGAFRGISAKSVMREITYALTQAFGLPERLSELLGITIREADIHNALVIAYLGKVFQNPEYSVFS